MSSRLVKSPVSIFLFVAALLCVGESARAQMTSTAVSLESQGVKRPTAGSQANLVVGAPAALQRAAEDDAPLSLRPPARWYYNANLLCLDDLGSDPIRASEQVNEKTKADIDDAQKGREAEDAVAQRQSVDYWNPIEDGQPGAPGNWEVKFDAGWKTFSGQHDPFALTSQVQYTPEGGHFLHNMKLGVAVPVTMGLGGVEGNGDAEFEWKQRWVAEHDGIPTMATVVDVRVPTGYHSSGVDGMLTGVVAKDLGPGTWIFNGFVETANGDNVEDLRHFQWGFRTGYKWRITDDFALIGDYIHRSSEEEGHANINSLQLSGEYHPNEHITIGPGITIGLDDHDETPNFGAGVRVQFTF